MHLLHSQLPIAVVTLATILAAATDLKYISVQGIEVLLLIVLCGWVILFLARGGKIRLMLQTRSYLYGYAVLLVGAGLLSLWAWQTTVFYIPMDVDSFLKLPLWISIARLFQLTLVVFGFVFFLNVLVRFPGAIQHCVAVYVWAGVASAIYGIFSIMALLYFNLDIGGAYYSDENHIRVRSLFIEGGPFGLYLASCILLTFFQRYTLHDISRLRFGVLLFLQIVGLVLSASKAGIVAAVSVLAIMVFIGKLSLKERILYVALTVIAVCAFITSPLSGQIRDYVSLMQNVEIASQQRANDSALVMGRVAGSYIVRQMIADRPVTGIGVGNYSLVRNNPAYRGALPEVDGWDLTGLGLLGYAAEFGLPLSILFVALLLRPVYYAWRKRAPGILFAIVLFQPIAHALGAQVTFFYPWILSAIGLAYLWLRANTLNGIPSRAFEIASVVLRSSWNQDGDWRE